MVHKTDSDSGHHLISEVFWRSRGSGFVVRLAEEVLYSGVNDAW